MHDDTGATAEPPRTWRAPNGTTVALYCVMALTISLAAISFAGSFEALRSLTIATGAVQPTHAWMTPVALDLAQAASTLALASGAFANRRNAARPYCLALATCTVLVSIAGNSFHGYRSATAAIDRAGNGFDLGYVPLDPVIAALITAIPPILWLALLHLLNILIDAVRGQRDNHDHQRLIASSVPAITDAADQPVLTPEPVGAPRTAAVAHTRNGLPQTTDGLREFIDRHAFTQAVQKVAVARIDNPRCNQVQIAEMLHRDKSTVSRHWATFVEAAHDEGFTVPPLPADMDEQRTDGAKVLVGFS